MKTKIFITLALLLGFVFTQSQNLPGIYRIPTTTTNFYSIYKAGSHIQVLSIPGYEYILKLDVGPPRNMAWVLLDSTRYAVISLNTGGAITISGDLEVGTLSTTTITATTGVFSGTLSATTINTGQGANELYGMDQGVKTTDSPTLAGLTITGTAGTQTLTVTSLGITAGTITGTAAMRGNAAFTTTETRVAVYIPGMTSTDYVIIQPVAATASTRPIPDDFCTSLPKTDSLVVQRAVGTTSGLSFDWIRIK